MYSTTNIICLTPFRYVHLIACAWFQVMVSESTGEEFFLCVNDPWLSGQSSSFKIANVKKVI